MKNVLFIHSSAELYGSDRSLLNIVKYIDKKIYKVYVILPYPGLLVDEIKKVPEVTVEIFEVAVLRRKNLSLSGGFEYFRNFNESSRYLKKFIKEHHIDIVDTNTAVVFPGAIAAKHMKIKSVWHIREIIKNKFENKIISLMMDCYADLIIANSKATEEALNINKNKIRVVYNAVEEKENVDIKPHDKLIVGMAGRINRWKGQKLLVDAAEIIHKSYPEVLFKIAGETFTGEEYLKKELEDYIAVKGLTQTVLLLGQINDMPSFYSDLDIFVLPSTQPEPFGIVVIEAMEFCLPVIATNHGGPTEIITDCVDGYLVDHMNAYQMAERIMGLLVNPQRRIQMGEKGQKKKRHLFSVAAMVKSVENVFEEVL